MNQPAPGTSRDSSFYPSTLWQSSDLLPPIVESQNVSKKPDLLFPSNITKDDLNDEFDEHQLLTLVSPKNRKNAVKLLNEFDKRANELTWNSSGVVFIDQDAVPNSNFYILFPLLFKRRLSKSNISGLNEVISKIHIMGLQDFIYSSNKSNKSTPKLENQNLDSENPIPWWYIGD